MPWSVDHIQQARAAIQLGEDEGAELAPPAEGAVWASGAMLFVQRLDLGSGAHLEHIGKDGVPMGYGSNPPVG
jgi:hypothetical protein